MTNRQPRTVRVIANPISGRGSVRRILPALCAVLKREGLDLTVHETRSQGDARTLAAVGQRQGVDALAVVGGDGTVREVAEGIVTALTDSAGCEAVPILVVPTGTENILAKYLGHGADPDAALRMLKSGRIAPFDVGLANGSPFLLVAGVGFDAEVVSRLVGGRTGHINYWSYFHPLWRTFWSYRQPYLQVEAEGATVFEGRGMVFVGNVPRYAIGLRLLARAGATDGLLDLCAFACRGRLGLLRHAANVLLRRHVDSDGVVYRQARSMTVRAVTEPSLHGSMGSADQRRASRSPAPPVQVEIDGDLGGTLPMTFEVSPQRLRFFVAG